MISRFSWFQIRSCLLAVVVVVCLLLLLLQWQWHRSFPGNPGKENFVEIPWKAGSFRIAHILEQKGVIAHWFWFLGYVKTVGHGRVLQAGEYLFDRPMTIPEAANKLFRGQVYFHEVVIPEGFSLFDIADLLEKRRLAPRAAFLEAARRGELIFDLAPQAHSLEGFLFPDTYRFPRHTTPEQIVQTMVSRFRQVYQERWKFLLAGNSMRVLEAVTLASLVEKETAEADERNRIAAVFRNRLKIGMPLQCDPTVIYAARLNGTFDGKIYQGDLASKSPYNTYVHAGLPPGPIANPGLKSIEAALEPASVDCLYFVSNHIGGHTFSKTLEAHNRAVAVYRRGAALPRH